MGPCFPGEVRQGPKRHAQRGEAGPVYPAPESLMLCVYGLYVCNRTLHDFLKLGRNRSGDLTVALTPSRAERAGGGGVFERQRVGASRSAKKAAKEAEGVS